MAVHEIRIDPAKPLREDPGTGHNRWHHGIPPVLRCEPGDEVVMGTRDAFDGQFGPSSTAEAVAAADLGVVHPLTGPVFVEGAEPGDLLEVEILDVAPDAFGFTAQAPGFGFLRDDFPEPYLVRWTIADGWATSDDLPGVRIPGAPFMGTIGLPPGPAALSRITAREQAAVDAGGIAMPPSAEGAVPSDPEIAATGLRTVPPREQGGNVDIKQLTGGTSLFLPVDAPGGLFSAGDAHFAQGDGEACGTAIEMRATLRVRFAVHKGEAREKGITSPRFSRTEYWTSPEYAAPRRFYATTGMPVSRDGGTVVSEDVTLAARNALLNMIDHLGERGWTRQQAYAICSVAVDLKISQLVDVPSVLVSAFLPLDIFSS
ncbi:acetamidase/formamidase family protein [Actinomadura sp. KC06]|uniref:acetamidase/formamidase family protein n=1 Tax=Actinomadura sp. KC06 TaxID=2530369 RepID=UPI0010517E23|nr:acetamidase/formamidase family protein [Actinomadura sp. KC06]TDD28091.1 acetamidase/formamidase family protein [Actinomadura sp. KC06]